MTTLLIKSIRRLEQNFQAPKMCYAPEGYVQSSVSDSLGLEQLKTLFYTLLAIELIGFVTGILENVTKPVLTLGSSETLEISSFFLERKYPVLCQCCSSNIMLILNQVDSESVGISELKKIFDFENFEKEKDSRFQNF